FAPTMDCIIFEPRDQGLALFSMRSLALNESSRSGFETAWSSGPASFTSLSHAAQHGVPVRIDISISDGPDAGFEDLFAHIAPLITATLPDDEVDAAEPAPPVRLDVERY